MKREVSRSRWFIHSAIVVGCARDSLSANEKKCILDSRSALVWDIFHRQVSCTTLRSPSTTQTHQWLSSCIPLACEGTSQRRRRWADRLGSDKSEAVAEKIRRCSKGRRGPSRPDLSHLSTLSRTLRRCSGGRFCWWSQSKAIWTDNAREDEREPSRSQFRREFLKSLLQNHCNHKEHLLTSWAVKFDTEFVQVAAKQRDFVLRLDELYHIGVHSTERRRKKAIDKSLGLFYVFEVVNLRFPAEGEDMIVYFDDPSRVSHLTELLQLIRLPITGKKCSTKLDLTVGKGFAARSLETKKIFCSFTFFTVYSLKKVVRASVYAINASISWGVAREHFVLQYRTVVHALTLAGSPKTHQNTKWP